MRRREAREVSIGDVRVGGENPVVIQSMTVSDTNSVAASTEEVIRLAQAGAQIVRLTVPSRKAAESLREVRDRVRARGVGVPLVADIHYTPSAAHLAAGIADKVRVNPGNFCDRPGRAREAESFQEGTARVTETFGPLVEKLKENEVALRIGVNHGSLSERMTAEYGDTPEGMVESALEYIAVCERLGYRDVVVSLKASIPAVTVAANRLFARKVDRSGGRYPLHVGVTEAGMGEEGRMRSASGIGALLLEGLGDTIRVSLTEDPVREIPAAREILEISGRLREGRKETGAVYKVPHRLVKPLAIGPLTVGGFEPVAVVAEGCRVGMAGDEPPDIVIAEDPAEMPRVAGEGRTVLLRGSDPDDIERLAAHRPHGIYLLFPASGGGSWGEAARAIGEAGAIPFVELLVEREKDVGPALDRLLSSMSAALEKGAVIAASGVAPVDLAAAVEAALSERSLSWPQLLIAGGDCSLLESTIALSPSLLDCLGSLIHVRGAREEGAAVRRAWDILQATRRRVTRVEYISCPSCGRTLFDLEEVTTRVVQRTSHLKGIKIAVMGCIVNGPGEMADADFGYVGSGPGKIDLYVGAQRMSRNIPENAAVDRLVDLIKEHGRWVD